MILPDVNLLIYAADERSAHHARARTWWEGQLSGSGLVGLTTTVVVAFVRIVTHPRITETPWSPEEALAEAGGWLAQPQVTTLHPGPRHLALLGEMLRHAGGGGDLVPDAHLAAIAVEHGATVCSADRGFARFAGVRWHDPLAAASA